MSCKKSSYFRGRVSYYLLMKDFDVKIMYRVNENSPSDFPFCVRNVFLCEAGYATRTFF